MYPAGPHDQANLLGFGGQLYVTRASFVALVAAQTIQMDGFHSNWLVCGLPLRRHERSGQRRARMSIIVIVELKVKEDQLETI
ncbi:MAG: hypothetical protein COB16_01360 [Rhodobacteraceae bacterium]|nr:MAG: hypothetical protein COB16_01360 [Paracoccaceae bacterium]